MAKAIFVATTVMRLPAKDAGVVASIVRVHPSRIGHDKSAKKSAKVERREPVRIVNEDTGAQTLRFAIGSGSMDIRSPNAVAADYDAFDALGIKPGEKVEVGVYRAGYITVFHYYLNHPDWGYRLATHMGAGGLVFGLIGAVLGTISLL